MYVKYYLREKERGEDGEREEKRGREGRALRRELQQRKASREKETEQHLQSSFIPSLTMWLKPKCETFKLTNQQTTASPTVQKVWQLADPRCINMLAYRPWLISAILCLQECQMALLLLKIVWDRKTEVFDNFWPYSSPLGTVGHT